MYSSNLSDQEWSQVEHFFERHDPRGAKSIHSKHTIVNAILKVLGLKLDIAKGIKGQWILLKKRWIVERTFAWFRGFRRLAKDFEILPQYHLIDGVGNLTNAAENMIGIAMIKVTLAKCII